MNTKDIIQKCIELAGGAKELVIKTGVSYKTVLDWKNGRSGISQLNCIKIEKALEGKIKREDILPDYPWEEFSPQEKNDEKSEIAKKMIEEGIDKNTVSKITGLSIEQIEKLED